MNRGNDNSIVKKTEDVSEMFAFIVDSMATKDDIADIRAEMATGLAAVRDELTNKIEDAKEEIMAEIRPMARAQDRVPR